MATNLVTVALDSLDQMGHSLGVPTQYKERGLGAVLIKNPEQPSRDGLQSALALGPLGSWKVRIKIEHLVPILQIEGKAVTELCRFS
jgi:hypothetical protein